MPLSSSEVDYPLIHESNTTAHHFIHGFTQFLERRLDVLSTRLDVVQSANESFRHTITTLHTYLLKAGIVNECIHGDVTVSERTNIFKRFQNDDSLRVLVIQPQAAAHGVTLTAADTIIWYSPVTSAETYLQANARIDRPGQRHPMTVVHIEGSPIERKLYNMLQNNISTHERIVDLYKKEMDET